MECVRRARHFLSRGRIDQQVRDFRKQRVGILDPDRRPSCERVVRRFGEVEAVLADEHWRPHRKGLDQRVRPEGQQAASDECDIGSGVIGEHFSHGVAEHDADVRRHRRSGAAPNKRKPAVAKNVRHRVEALRMPRHD